MADEASEADEAILVCVLASDKTPFTDNIFTKCSDCGIGVQHRPNPTHVPEGVMPRPVCWECGMAQAQEDAEAGEEVKFILSKKAIDEVLEYKRKKLQ